MRTRVDTNVVDESRNGRLVHRATSSGRELEIVTYIEGLQGDTTGRYEMATRVLCRTQEQAAKIAQLLTEARG